MAILGDSTSTGALANPEASLGLPSLLSHGLEFLEFWVGHPGINAKKYPELAEFNVKSPVKPLTRIWYSAAEEKKQNELALEIQDRVTDDFADFPEFSWGYLVGRSLGIEPKKIELAGQDGKRIDQISNQFSRLDRLGYATLPELVFVSFTINDICKETNFDMDLEQFKKAYYESFKAQFESVMSSHQAAASGTHIYVLAPVPVAAELTNASILEKVIPIPNGKARCEDIRSQKTDFKFFGFSLDSTLYHMCPAVLKTQANDEARIRKLGLLLDGIKDMQSLALKELNESSVSANNGFRYTHITEISDAKVDAPEIANDCFHPSMEGHMNIARIILKAIKTDL